MKHIVEGAAALVGAMLLLTVAPVSGQDRDPRLARGEQLFASQGCYGCHHVGKFGTPIGPDLSHVGVKYSASYIRQWLRDPQSVRSAAHMQKLELSGEEVNALAAYLASLK